MSGAAAFLRHPMLEACGVEHGFGVLGAVPPAGLLRPRQVHGIDVASLSGESLAPEEADAVVSRHPGRPIGVVTADCVPVLAAARDGRSVAAIHAGWRGVAAGVVESAVAALRGVAGAQTKCVAVIGPHIGGCCYEVDAPVFDALRQRFPKHLEASLRPTRPGHARLEMASLVRVALLRQGMEPDAVAVVPDACTHCNPDRFHSFRRDGAAAGRLLHYVAASS